LLILLRYTYRQLIVSLTCRLLPAVSDYLDRRPEAISKERAEKMKIAKVTVLGEFGQARDRRSNPQMPKSSMKGKPFSGAICVLLLFLAVSLLARCGGSGAKGQMPPPQNQNPTITSISPNNALAGGAAFTLTITGTNFVAASMVDFGGSPAATTFVSSTQLTAAISAASIASAGTPGVRVTNPAPDGGTSNAINFSVNAITGTVPTITLLAPSCAPAGVPVQLQVVGTNFMSSSVVQWNGSNRPTTVDAINGLVAQISASDVAAAGTAEVTVFNPGTGGGSSTPSTFTTTPGAVDPQSIAVDPAGKFAYVASEGCDGFGFVSMYSIDPTTGALTSIGPPVPTNDELTDSVTVDPSGKFAYVTSSGDVWDIDFGSIVTYSINPTTGALTPATGVIGGELNGTPGFFNSMAFDPSGKFAYAADGGAFPEGTFGGSSNVSMYTRDSTTGALTYVGTSAAGTGSASVALDPTGKFAYTANFGSNDVSMYTIDAATGVLASTGTIAAGTQPVSFVEDSAGSFAYVANFGSNDVSMYTINASTGALTSIGTIAAGVAPISVVVDPAGKFAYAANFNSNDVSMYTINATTGALTSIGTIATDQSPTSIAVHPSGKFAYVTNSASNDVSIYSIDGTTGALTLVGTIGT
jgi:6-phosphogluconolactonase (cycloisomerase 2 family)